MSVQLVICQHINNNFIDCLHRVLKHHARDLEFRRHQEPDPTAKSQSANFPALVLSNMLTRSGRLVYLKLPAITTVLQG